MDIYSMGYNQLFFFFALIILTKVSTNSFMFFPVFLQQAPSFLLAFLALLDIPRSYFPCPSFVCNQLLLQGVPALFMGK